MKTLAQYEILEELGHGGFAVVYRAYDTRVEREVALKVIHGSFVREKKFVERFRREARTAANLNHPNIVSVYDFGDADGELYLAMALVGEGRTLRDLLSEQGPLCLEHALPILAQLSGALDYLRSQDPPLVHRDVKPSNVLLGGDADAPWVVLTDFGLVRSLQARTELTQKSTILGSPSYMAPEQADPKKWGETTPLTDVYALGVVSYEMLVGCVPFEGESLALMYAHANESPIPPLEIAPELGDDLGALLLRALAKPPTERYAGAGALVVALREAADARTQAAAREATLEQLEAQAKELLQAGEWLEALDCCTHMVRLDPDRPAALEMLTAAKQGLDRQQADALQRRRLEEQYEQGLKLLGDGKWKQAIAALEGVKKGNPDFRDVQEKLLQAQDELQRAQWYDEAIAHGEAGRWAEACRAWVDVLRGRLTYRDGDAAERLLDAADGLLGQYAQVQQAHEVLLLYEDLAIAVEEKEWERAAQAGERLSKLAPSLECPHTWLERARGKLKQAEDLGKDRKIRERDGKEMVRISAGEFLYGEDKKKHTLPEYMIDKAPVTNAEYGRFVADTGHDPPEHWHGNEPPKQIADHPVVDVSWRDAVTYAEWAGVRLPSEEEWEKAARGTDGREYPWGNQEPTRELCNFNNNEKGTTPVGKYSPQGDSPYGCVDMAGNVWEWTASEHEKGGRMLRGGAFNYSQWSVRCACRVGGNPLGRYDYVGFRLVMVSPSALDSEGSDL
jgi:formylglycine-generating enzyme required for sulfatase activity